MPHPQDPVPLLRWAQGFCSLSDLGGPCGRWLICRLPRCNDSRCCFAPGAAGPLQQVRVIATTSTYSPALLPRRRRCPFQTLHSGRQLGANPPKLFRCLKIQAEVSRTCEALLRSTLSPILPSLGDPTEQAWESGAAILHRTLHEGNFCVHNSSGARDLLQGIGDGHPHPPQPGAGARGWSCVSGKHLQHHTAKNGYKYHL